MAGEGKRSGIEEVEGDTLLMKWASEQLR
jgi:hypothetical protein